MSVEARTSSGFATVPQPEFEVVAAAHLAFAAAPTMVFSVKAHELGVLEIQSMSLSVQVMIDPARRGYDENTREQLTELFGPAATWAPSTQGLNWARVAAAVPGFQRETVFGLEVPCTYDLEVAATKYFYAVADGVVPLSFHFYGTVFYRAPDGRLQMTPVPWSASAQFGMPVSAWQAMIAEHYPAGGWIRLSERTLAALNAFRAQRGLTFDDTVQELLGRDR